MSCIKYLPQAQTTSEIYINLSDPKDTYQAAQDVLDTHISTIPLRKTRVLQVSCQDLKQRKPCCGK